MALVCVTRWSASLMQLYYFDMGPRRIISTAAFPLNRSETISPAGYPAICFSNRIASPVSHWRQTGVRSHIHAFELLLKSSQIPSFPHQLWKVASVICAELNGLMKTCPSWQWKSRERFLWWIFPSMSSIALWSPSQEELSLFLITEFGSIQCWPSILRLRSSVWDVLQTSDAS